jgi:glycosyltransferase involved in cell wall biosynthesis
MSARPSTPELTVIIPTRDRSEQARQATLCAVRQREVDVEVIIVDDGSAEPHAQRLADFQSGFDGQVRLIRNEVSQGVARARNAGIAQARGAWIGFCDDDDIWAPDKARRSLEAGWDTRLGWTCSAALKVDRRLSPFVVQRPPEPVTVARELLGSNVIPGGASNVIARTELVRAVGAFDPQFSALADWDLWIRLALAAPLGAIPEPLVAYVTHAGQMSDDVKRLWTELEVLLAKYEGARAAHGVSFNECSWRAYIGDKHLVNSHRFAAAYQLSYSALLGRWRMLKPAAMGLFSPYHAAAARRSARNGLIATQWGPEFSSWLPAERETIRPATGAPPPLEPAEPTVPASGPPEIPQTMAAPVT